MSDDEVTWGDYAVLVAFCASSLFFLGTMVFFAAKNLVATWSAVGMPT